MKRVMLLALLALTATSSGTLCESPLKAGDTCAGTDIKDLAAAEAKCASTTQPEAYAAVYQEVPYELGD